MNIRKLNTDHIWNNTLYDSGKYDKKVIVLHHTVSYSALGSLEYLKIRSSKTMRKSKPYPVGVPFLIDRDGTNYQAFSSSGFAYHIGIRNRAYEEKTIGIELANLGYLVEKNGTLYDVYGKEFYGNSVHLKEKWRGFSYFEPYTKEQIDSLVSLCEYLFERYDIDRKIPSDFYPRNPWRKSRYKNFSGVLSHVHFRKPNEKWDLSPAFREWFSYFVEALNLEVV